MKYHIATTKQGNTVLGCSSNGVTAYPMLFGDSIETTHEFTATHAEYAELLGKQHTHDLELDPKTKRVTAHARPGKEDASHRPELMTDN